MMHVHMIEEETFIWQDSSVLAGNHLFSIVAMIRDRHKPTVPSPNPLSSVAQ